jgi:hypothetical protein
MSNGEPLGPAQRGHLLTASGCRFGPAPNPNRRPGGVNG